MLGQLAEELESDVGDDLDVHPGVVVDLHAHDRVHVRGVPPRLQLLVLVHPLEQLAQLAVAANRQVDVHLLDRLRRSQARLAHRLLGDRLVDPLLGLLVEIHRGANSIVRRSSSVASSVTQLRPLGVGEILDVAIKIYRRNFRTLLTLVFVVVAPFEILSALIQASAIPDNGVPDGHDTRSGRHRQGVLGRHRRLRGRGLALVHRRDRRHRRLLQGDRRRLPRRASRVAPGARLRGPAASTRSSG